MHRREFICSIPVGLAASASGCIGKESEEFDAPVYTSWMPHPNELPQKPESEYIASSTKSESTLNSLLSSVEVEGIEHDRYTSIRAVSSRQEFLVTLDIIEYSGDRSSFREYLYSDEYLLDGELDISELDSHRGYSLFVVERVEKSTGGVYLGDGELIFYEELNGTVQSNLFAETAIDLREGEIPSYYEQSRSFRDLVELAGNRDFNSAAPVPDSDVNKLGIESYALSHDYVSVNENNGGFKIGATLSDGSLSDESVLEKKEIKNIVNKASLLLGSVSIRQHTTSEEGNHVVATGEIGIAPRAEVLTNVNDERKKIRFTVTSLGNSDYIIIEGGKGATVDGANVREGEYVYLDTVGSQVNFDFSGSVSGQMTAKAVIGPKPPGVDNGDVTDTGIQDSAIRTAVAIVEYDFSN